MKPALKVWSAEYVLVVVVENAVVKTPVVLLYASGYVAESEVLEKRESQSRPDRGVVTVETRGFNQRGEEVCYFRRKVMVPKRDAAPPRQRPYTSPDTTPA